jgi:hypothetical protein
MSVAALELDALTGYSSSEYMIRVDFAAPYGRRWSAIGGGATLREAIGFARESCPTGVAWEAIGWNDLYGD